MDVAQHVGDLTPEWLTARLRAVGVIRAACVIAVETSPLGGFGMTGDLHRIRLRYDRREQGVPDSLVAKFAARDDDLRAIVHSMGFYEREVNFYLQLRLTAPVHTPTCYFAWVDADSGRSLLLLEDLSALTTPGWLHGVTVPEAEAVLRELAGLHARWWADDRLRALPWLSLKGTAAIDQVGPAFVTHWQSFLDKLSVPLTDDVLDIGRCARRHLPTVFARLYGEGPSTLVHNDVQGDNILLDQDRRSVVLLDWQLATIGRGPVDVAFFLGGNLVDDDCRRNWDRLVSAYHADLCDRGVVGYGLEQCHLDCRLALLPAATRVATAVGAHPGLRASPGAFWNTVFLRYARAAREYGVASLCAEQLA